MASQERSDKDIIIDIQFHEQMQVMIGAYLEYLNLPLKALRTIYPDAFMDMLKQ
jgi:hypothetical protein